METLAVSSLVYLREWLELNKYCQIDLSYNADQLLMTHLSIIDGLDIVRRPIIGHFWPEFAIFW